MTKSRISDARLRELREDAEKAEGEANVFSKPVALALLDELATQRSSNTNPCRFEYNKLEGWVCRVHPSGAAPYESAPPPSCSYRDGFLAGLATADAALLSTTPDDGTGVTLPAKGCRCPECGRESPSIVCPSCVWIKVGRKDERDAIVKHLCKLAALNEEDGGCARQALKAAAQGIADGVHLRNAKDDALAAIIGKTVSDVYYKSDDFTHPTIGQAVIDELRKRGLLKEES